MPFGKLKETFGSLRFRLMFWNTLVLFLGDNGPSQPFARERSGGLRGQKLSLYEGGTRVPFVAWWPAQLKGGRVNEQTVIAAIDLLPTLATVCGARLPAGYVPDGEDMTAAVKGETPIRKKPLFWEYGRNAAAFAYPMDAKHRSPNVAVRDGNWKLLVNADGTGAELFDLGADLSVPYRDGDGRLRITQDYVERLEAECDAANELLPDLQSFVLPGGSEEAARLLRADESPQRFGSRILAERLAPPGE